MTTSKPVRSNRKASRRNAKAQYPSIEMLATQAPGFATKLQLAAEVLADAAATAKAAELTGAAQAAGAASAALQSAAQQAGIRMRAISGYAETPYESVLNLASAITALNSLYQQLAGVPGGEGLLRAVYGARMQAAGVRERLKGVGGKSASLRSSSQEKGNIRQLTVFQEVKKLPYYLIEIFSRRQVYHTFKRSEAREALALVRRLASQGYRGRSAPQIQILETIAAQKTFRVYPNGTVGTNRLMEVYLKPNTVDAQEIGIYQSEQMNRRWDHVPSKRAAQLITGLLGMGYTLRSGMGALVERIKDEAAQSGKRAPVRKSARKR